MTAIQTRIMKLVDQWAKKFDSCLPAGDNAIVFRCGADSIVIQCADAATNVYRVISRKQANASVAPMLSGYFTERELTAAL